MVLSDEDKCESPLEIRKPENGSFARWEAVGYVVLGLRDEEKEEEAEKAPPRRVVYIDVADLSPEQTQKVLESIRSNDSRSWGAV
jgi:hypothetical protein